MYPDLCLRAHSGEDPQVPRTVANRLQGLRARGRGVRTVVTVWGKPASSLAAPAPGPPPVMVLFHRVGHGPAQARPSLVGDSSDVVGDAVKGIWSQWGKALKEAGDRRL
jgi:hypothetical protein